LKAFGTILAMEMEAPVLLDRCNAIAATFPGAAAPPPSCAGCAAPIAAAGTRAP